MAQLVNVTVLKGLLYGGKWRIEGAKLEMDAHRAQVLSETKPPHVALGNVTVKADGPTPAAKSDETPASGEPGELQGWPGDEALAAAGIETIDALRALIDEHGDAWPKQVDGVGPATAAKIVDELDALDA